MAHNKYLVLVKIQNLSTDGSCGKKKERKKGRQTDIKKVTLHKCTTIKHQFAKCYLISYS